MTGELQDAMHALARQLDREADAQMNLARGAGDLEHELRTGQALAKRDAARRIHVAADDGAGDRDGQVSAAVITATPTVCDGLVLRWRRRPASEPVVSASSHSVMVHGDATVDDDLMAWIGDARRVREMLAAGRREQAQALATHKYAKVFGLDLVPVTADSQPPA